jgi:hypothetical protein
MIDFRVETLAVVHRRFGETYRLHCQGRINAEATSRAYRAQKSRPVTCRKGNTIRPYSSKHSETRALTYILCLSAGYKLNKSLCFVRGLQFSVQLHQGFVKTSSPFCCGNFSDITVHRVIYTRSHRRLFHLLGYSSIENFLRPPTLNLHVYLFIT